MMVRKFGVVKHLDIAQTNKKLNGKGVLQVNKN